MIDQKFSAPAHPPTRELRGLALYREYREMFRFEQGVWLVPSLSSVTTVYEVTLDPEATCECRDFGFRYVPCLHIYAATVARSKMRPCAGCGGRFRGRELTEVDPETLTFFEGDELCRSCVRTSGEVL